MRRKTLGIPGVGVGLIQDGKVVFAGGKLTWETPVTSLLPSFRLGDADTMRATTRPTSTAHPRTR